MWCCCGRPTPIHNHKPKFPIPENPPFQPNLPNNENNNIVIQVEPNIPVSNKNQEVIQPPVEQPIESPSIQQTEPPKIKELNIEISQKESLELKPNEKTKQELDEEEFNQKISQIQEIIKSSKNQFSIAYTDSFTQNNDNTVLSNKAGRQDTTGPLIKDKRISNINQQDKYNFAQVLEQREFKEYEGKIYIERLLEKPKHSVCSYLGKIDERYCCVKLIPCIKKESADKWIKAIQDYQKIKNSMFEKTFQLYYFYQIELIENQPFVNLYIISNLEQYNAYTFAIDEKTTIEQRAKVAYDCIQILSNVLMSKYDEKQGMGNNNANLQYARIQQVKKIYKNIFTVKNNNILISILEDGQCKVQLSDWQLLVDEFQEIIPKEEIQDVDHEMQSNLFATSQLLQQNSDKKVSQIDQLTFGQARQQVEKFIKTILNLLIFNVNNQLGEAFKVKNFITKQYFEQQSIFFNEVCKNDEQTHIETEKKISEAKEQLEQNEYEYCIQRSNMMARQLGTQILIPNPKLFVLFLITQMQDCEGMRPSFAKYILQDLNVMEQRQPIRLEAIIQQAR